MGPLRGGGGHFDFRLVFRRRARLHSLDDNGRTFQPRAASGGHVHCGARQLVGQFPCRPLLLASQGAFCYCVRSNLNADHFASKTGGAAELHFLAVQRLVGFLLGFHLQDRSRDEEQDFRRDFRSFQRQRPVSKREMFVGTLVSVFHLLFSK